MLHIVMGSLVIHLVDIACLTESQKLAHLIYLEQLTWIPINAGEAPEDSMTPMIGVSRDVELDPDKSVHIMHITVGTSAVHLVGKKSVMEFDMFTMSLYEEDMGPSGGVLIYLEEPERREGFEGPYYEISSLD